MIDVDEPRPHTARLDSLVEEADRLASLAAHGAQELAEDGAQPHLIAAMSEFEAALRTERDRLTDTLAGRTPGQRAQQALAI